MKFIYLYLLLLLSNTSKTQVIDFPDSNFKARLLSSHFSFIAMDINGNYMTIDANGNGKIEQSEASQVYMLDVSSSTISDLSGIEYFYNLTNLNCQENNLTSIDLSALTNLTRLVCNFNKLTSLDLNALTNLTDLYCSSNSLTSLDLKGLLKLSYFECAENKLTTLDLSGLTNLKKVFCTFNSLTTLNLTGLTSLWFIHCADNLLTTIDLNGLINLQYLICYSNRINSLPLSDLPSLQVLECSGNNLINLNFTGVTSLRKLECAVNKMVSLDVSGLTNLVTLICGSNSLTSLNIQGVINLKELDCRNSQLIGIDFFGLKYLTHLTCDNCKLTSLNISGLNNLVSLVCDKNSLINLDLSGLKNLTRLSCSKNKLTSLDLNDDTLLNTLDCSYNDLKYLFIKNGINEVAIDFSSNPNLSYICADDIQLKSINDLIKTYGYINCHVNTYCSFNPGGSFYTIQGNIKYDYNSNSCDTLDRDVSNLIFNITNGTNNGKFISNQIGFYSIPLSADFYSITPVLENPNYFKITPPNLNVSFPTQPSPYIQDFCLAATGIHPDVQVKIIPISAARPGFDAIYHIIYSNYGTEVEKGSIVFNFQDDILDYISSSPNLDNQTFGTLSWNFTNLIPFETRKIELKLNINTPMEIPPVNVGDILKFDALIASSNIDEKPNDNLFSLRQSVVGAVDPNDKTCLEGETFSTNLIGEYIHYMIRFENIGTYAATNIVVKDIIDTSKFEISTLSIVYGSHTFYTRIKSNIVEFIFEEINLPFDIDSKDGFVIFKIKTKPNLKAGDTISNLAQIYFDYNRPIATNNFSSSFQTATSISDFDIENEFSIYPNPVKNELNFKLNARLQVKSIKIYNTLGQVVLVKSNVVNVIDVTSLQRGNYYLQINTEKASFGSHFTKK